MNEKSTTILTSLLLLLASCGYSQMVPGSSKVLFEYGYVSAKGEERNVSLDGTTIAGSFERLASNGKMGLGIMLSYLKVNDEAVLDNNVPVFIDYTSLPVFALFNYYFTTTKLTSYAGFGIGLHFSHLDQTNAILRSDRGMAVAVPMGISWYFVPSVALEANYRFNYMGSSYLGNGLAHTLNIGLSYTFW